MAKRSPHTQRKHDAQVRKDAAALIRQGYKVKADLEGFEKPPTLGKDGHIPDIFARKRGRVIIEEVETPDTDARDAAQHATFRRSAAHRKGGHFRKRIAK